MKTATVGWLAAAAKTASKPVWLLQVDNGGTTYYYSDRDVTVGSTAYKSRVIDWGDISLVTERLTGGGVVSRTQFVMSEMDSTGMSPISPIVTINDDCRVYLWFDGESLVEADALLIWVGRVTDPIEVSQTRFTMTIAGVEIGFNAVVGELLNQTDFPGADPDDIGKVKPIIYGQVYGHRCLSVDAGSISPIFTALNDSETGGIDVSDGSIFPGSGTVQIDQEQITYTGKSGNQLTGLARGVNSTTAAEHAVGALCVEIQTVYRYMIADHEVDTGSAIVYVDETRQSGSDFDVLNEEGKAYVDFNTQPTLAKGAGIEVAVIDDIGVDDTDLNVTSSGDAPRTTWQVASSGVPAAMSNDGGSITISFPNPSFSINDWVLTLEWGVNFTFTGTGNILSIDFNGTDIYRWVQDSGAPVMKLNRVPYSNDINSDSLIVHASSGITSWGVSVSGASRDVFGTQTITSTKDTEASKTIGTRDTVGQFNVVLTGNTAAETVIGEKVTVDIIGKSLENPSAVINDLLTTYGNGITGGDLDVSITTPASYPHDSSYKLGFAIRQQMNLMELCRAIAWQTRARFYWDSGTARLSLIENNIDFGQIDTDLDGTEQIMNSARVFFTPYDQIFNKSDSKYNYSSHAPLNKVLLDGSGDGRLISSYVGDNATSQTEYGILDASPLLELNLLSDATTAQTVTDFYMSYFGSIGKMITVKAHVGWATVERGDNINITNSINGGVIYMPVEVMSIDYNIGSGSQKIPDSITITGIVIGDGIGLPCNKGNLVYINNDIETTRTLKRSEFNIDSSVTTPDGVTLTIPDCTSYTVKR